MKKVSTTPFCGIQHFTCPYCETAYPVGFSFEELAGIRNFRPTYKTVLCKKCNKPIQVVFRYNTRYEGIVEGDILL